MLVSSCNLVKVVNSRRCENFLCNNEWNRVEKSKFVFFQIDSCYVIYLPVYFIITCLILGFGKTQSLTGLHLYGPIDSLVGSLKLQPGYGELLSVSLLLKRVVLAFYTRW